MLFGKLYVLKLIGVGNCNSVYDKEMKLLFFQFINVS